MKVYKIIKGEVRKRLERREGGESFFLYLFGYILEPMYQTTLHETQTRQDSRNVT